MTVGLQPRVRFYLIIDKVIARNLAFSLRWRLYVGYPGASGSRTRHFRPSTSPDLQIQPDAKPSKAGTIRDDG